MLGGAESKAKISQFVCGNLKQPKSAKPLSELKIMTRPLIFAVTKHLFLELKKFGLRSGVISP